MGFNQVIKTHVQPSIKLITLDDFDNSAESTTPSVTRKNKGRPDFSQLAGSIKPFIKLAGQVITDIEYLTIDESGFIPKLDLTFTDPAGEFSGNYFPKRNLMLSVFINSGNDKLKPVRSDYLITKVKSIPITNRGTGIAISQGTTYMIKAELFVPRLYNNTSKSYPNLTSVDAIKTVCSELGLGYAQNEFTPADAMTWINYNTSPLNFLREITNYVYQDDESFFTGFISKELIFNLIDVNQQLIKSEVDDTFSSNSNPLSLGVTQTQKNNPANAAFAEEVVVNFLTNIRKNINKPNYIYEANLISDQGAVLKQDGYKKKIYYYDHFEPVETDDTGKPNKFKQFFVAPNNAPDLPESTMLIPDDEGMDEIGNKKWMNINYGNTHEHWNAARVFNSHNLKELEKIKLRVLLKGVNFQVIRGMVVPVVMSLSLGEKIRKESDPDGNTQIDLSSNTFEGESIDSELTGWYYVKEAKYTFDPKDPHIFYTELILSRREWVPNKIIFTANA
jgi:hypothetical protein